MKFKLTIIFKAFLLCLIIITSGCYKEEVLPPLTEKDAAAPTVTIKTKFPDNTDYWSGVYTGLIEVKTNVLFAAEASNPTDEDISYSWKINNEVLNDEASDLLYYSFSNPGKYTIKAIATSSTGSTEDTLGVNVFEFNKIMGRTIKDGSYIAKFDCDDDGEDETFTYTFSGKNVELKIDGADFGPSDSYTLKGNWWTDLWGEGSGKSLSMEFLLKKDVNNEEDTLINIGCGHEWMIFDYDGKTYLNIYPLDRGEHYGYNPFPINENYWSDIWANIIDNSTNSSVSLEMNQNGMFLKYSLFCGIDQDSNLVSKNYPDTTFDYNYDELVNGALNHIQFNGKEYLFYSGETPVMRNGFLFEKQ